MAFYKCNQCNYKINCAFGEEKIIEHIENKHGGDADANISQG